MFACAVTVVVVCELVMYAMVSHFWGVSQTPTYTHMVQHPPTLGVIFEDEEDEDLPTTTITTAAASAAIVVGGVAHIPTPFENAPDDDDEDGDRVPHLYHDEEDPDDLDLVYDLHSHDESSPMEPVEGSPGEGGGPGNGSARSSSLGARRPTMGPCRTSFSGAMTSGELQHADDELNERSGVSSSGEDPLEHRRMANPFIAALAVCVCEGWVCFITKHTIHMYTPTHLHIPLTHAKTHNKKTPLCLPPSKHPLRSPNVSMTVKHSPQPNHRSTLADDTAPQGGRLPTDMACFGGVHLGNKSRRVPPHSMVVPPHSMVVPPHSMVVCHHSMVVIRWIESAHL